MGFPSFARHPSQLSSPYALPAPLHQPASEGTDSRIDVDYGGEETMYDTTTLSGLYPKERIADAIQRDVAAYFPNALSPLAR
jgi:hypothetical protein